MKQGIIKNRNLLLALFAVILTAGLVSWDYQRSPGQYEQTGTDTVPKKSARPAGGKPADRDKKIRDPDDVLKELEEADMQVDFEKMRKELAESLKQIDGDKIRLEIEKAMKDVDMDKIRKEVQESLAKVDFDKIKVEIANAMKEVDMAKIQKEIQESLAKVDFDKIKAEIADAMKEVEKVKELDMKKLDEDMKKLREELKDIQPRVEKELANAKVELEKAKADLKEFKGFVDGLEKDGLISKKEGYTLKHKDGELLINGKKATEQVYNKYRYFLEKHKKFSIEKTDNDFDMDLD